MVSVPLRGVGCFPGAMQNFTGVGWVSVPLRGVGCFC